MNRRFIFTSLFLLALPLLLMVTVFWISQSYFASFESAQPGFRQQLIEVIFPLLSIIGLSITAMILLIEHLNSK